RHWARVPSAAVRQGRASDYIQAWRAESNDRRTQQARSSGQSESPRRMATAGSTATVNASPRFERAHALKRESIGASGSERALLRAGTAAGAETAHTPAAGPFVREAPASLSCVIPSLDEAENLLRLLPLLCEALARQVAQWEVIVVDDGSRD